MSRQPTDRRLQTLEVMRQRALEAFASARQARFEDFMFLVQTGTPVEQAAQRLGTNPVALSRQAYRHQRHDIARLLNTAARQQRYHL